MDAPFTILNRIGGSSANHILMADELIQLSKEASSWHAPSSRDTAKGITKIKSRLSYGSNISGALAKTDNSSLYNYSYLMAKGQAPP